MGAQFGVFFPFQPRLQTFAIRMSATPKMEVHLEVIGLHPLHSTPFVKMCFTPKHIFGLMGPRTSHLSTNPMLGL